MADPVTSALAIPYPVGTDNVSDGPAEMEAIATQVDAVVAAALADILQPGVVTAGAGLVANPAVSGAGAVSGTGVGTGNAYILISAGNLVRNVIPTGSFSSTPTLPAAGKYACVGIDLAATTWGGAASLALSSKGSDQTTSALALANPPAVATGRLRLMNTSILNTAGTYSLAASQDVRTYAAALNYASRTAARFYYSSGTTNLGVSATVPFNVASFDTGSNFNTSTHLYTVPQTGLYLVNASIGVVFPGSGSAFVSMNLKQNGGLISAGDGIQQAGAGQTWSGGTSDIVSCAVGDTLGLSAGSSGGTAVLQSGTTVTYMSVIRVG